MLLCEYVEYEVYIAGAPFVILLTVCERATNLPDDTRLSLSELMLLKQLEEVLDFEGAVLGHVSAVDGVADAIKTELGADRVWTQMSGDLGVVGTAEFTEGCHCILLSDFEGNTGTS